MGDRRGHRGTLIAGVAIFALGSVASALAHSLTTLAIARFVCGAGSGIVSLAIVAYVSVAVPYSTRGRAMGIVQAGYLVALLAGVPLGALVAEKLGARTLFLGLSALSALLFVALLGLDAHPGRSKGSPWRDLGALLSDGPPRIGLAIAFFTALGVAAPITFLGAWLVKRFGLTTSEVGVRFALAGIAALVAAPLSGSISDRVGKRPVAAIAGVGLAACLAALPLLDSSQALVVAAFFGAIFFESARRGPLQALYTALVPLERVGAFTAFKNAAALIGQASGALYGAIVFERSNGFAFLCLASAGATVASVLLLALARRPDAALLGSFD